jgi:hypothetical protein
LRRIRQHRQGGGERKGRRLGRELQRVARRAKPQRAAEHRGIELAATGVCIRKAGQPWPHWLPGENAQRPDHIPQAQFHALPPEVVVRRHLHVVRHHQPAARPLHPPDGILGQQPLVTQQMVESLPDVAADQRQMADQAEHGRVAL